MQMKDSFYSFIQTILFTKDILRVEKCWSMICQTPETGSMRKVWRKGKQLKTKSSSSQQNEAWLHKDDTQVQIQVEINGNSGSLNAGVDTQKEVQQLTSQPP